MLLMIDNYDSFVYNLVLYFEELGEEVIVYKNDEITIEIINEMNCHGIVISPGPKSPKEAGISLDIIDKFKGKIPILGICLGHQCIGEYFGLKVIKGKCPMHGKLSLINHDNSTLFKDIKNPLLVTRYHSLVIDTKEIPEDIKITAKTEEDVIMAIEHKVYPVFGVQFHPEAHLTEEGHGILKNFIIGCKR